MPTALRDGFYAVPYGSGFRLIWLRTVDEGIDKRDAKYRRILFYKVDGGWQSFAFLNDDGAVQFYVKYLLSCAPEQIESIRQAVAEIRRNPKVASELYEQLKPTPTKQMS